MANPDKSKTPPATSSAPPPPPAPPEVDPPTLPQDPPPAPEQGMSLLQFLQQYPQSDEDVVAVLKAIHSTKARTAAEWQTLAAAIPNQEVAQ